MSHTSLCHCQTLPIGWGAFFFSTATSGYSAPRTTPTCPNPPPPTRPGMRPSLGSQPTGCTSRRTLTPPSPAACAPPTPACHKLRPGGSSSPHQIGARQTSGGGGAPIPRRLAAGFILHYCFSAGFTMEMFINRQLCLALPAPTLGSGHTQEPVRAPLGRAPVSPAHPFKPIHTPSYGHPYLLRTPPPPWRAGEPTHLHTHTVAICAAATPRRRQVHQRWRPIPRRAGGRGAGGAVARGGGLRGARGPGPDLRRRRRRGTGDAGSVRAVPRGGFRRPRQGRGGRGVVRCGASDAAALSCY